MKIFHFLLTAFEFSDNVNQDSNPNMIKHMINMLINISQKDIVYREQFFVIQSCLSYVNKHIIQSNNGSPKRTVRANNVAAVL